ncbi:MAG: hypothetical protein U5S82_20380 [Gammaproteobacteria bacterium]|nr:hypothetical protein [Gammaproteobacteria bacterium]
MTRTLAICLTAWALGSTGAAADSRYDSWRGGGEKVLFEVRDRTWSEGFAGIALTNLDDGFAVMRLTLLGGRP